MLVISRISQRLYEAQNNFPMVQIMTFWHMPLSCEPVVSCQDNTVSRVDLTALLPRSRMMRSNDAVDEPVTASVWVLRPPTFQRQKRPTVSFPATSCVVKIRLAVLVPAIEVTKTSVPGCIPVSPIPLASPWASDRLARRGILSV